MRTTKKDMMKFISENKFDVISFNQDGSRALHYGNGNPLQCFATMVQESKRGKRVLLFPNKFEYFPKITGNKDNSQIDPEFYNKVAPYAISIEQFYR